LCMNRVEDGFADVLDIEIDQARFGPEDRNAGDQLVVRVARPVGEAAHGSNSNVSTNRNSS